MIAMHHVHQRGPAPTAPHFSWRNVSTWKYLWRSTATPSHVDSDGFHARVGARCEKGGYRVRNEDRCYADVTRGLYFVADGIGGAVGGSEASQILLEMLPAELEHILDGRSVDPLELQEAVQDALSKARQRMRIVAARHPQYRNMGATVALAILAGDMLYVAHAGDARVYLERDGELERLTTDETFVQMLVDAGISTESEARSNPRRHFVLNWVGPEGLETMPRLKAIPVRAGDHVMVCTDGLSATLGDDELQEAIHTASHPQEVADALVLSALRGGTHDNVACVFVKLAANTLHAACKRE